MGTEISKLVDDILTDDERALPVDAAGCYEKYGVKFHELAEHHLERLRSLRTHPEIQQFMLFRDDITPEMQRQWFRDNADARANHRESYTMLEFRGEIVGMTQLKDIDYWPGRSAESGIIMFPEHQGGLLPYRVAIGGLDSAFLHRGLETITGTFRRMNTRAHRFVRSIGYELVDRDPNNDILHGSLRVDAYFRAAKKWRPLLVIDAEQGFPLA